MTDTTTSATTTTEARRRYDEVRRRPYPLWQTSARDLAAAEAAYEAALREAARIVG